MDTRPGSVLVCVCPSLWNPGVLRTFAEQAVRARPSSRLVTSLTEYKFFSLCAVFEDPITRCLGVAVRDDHSPVVVRGFLFIVAGCGQMFSLPLRPAMLAQ